MSGNVKKKDERTRNWLVIVYPESAPENWEDVLNELQFKWAHSPLHDRDVNPTGEVKKAHWHCIFFFEGNKSYAQVKEIADMVNGAPPKPCISAVGSIRYFLHLDNPEKAQYSKDGIVTFGGCDLADYLSYSKSQLDLFATEMFNWIEETDCTEFSDLMDYARHNEPDTWYHALLHGYTIVFNAYFRSKRGKRSAVRVALESKNEIDCNPQFEALMNYRKNQKDDEKC
ncbi:MAG: replication protein [Oscillospiraceae bacterium]|nr:replication protein [Oscillospiraceae bacterium]